MIERRIPTSQGGTGSRPRVHLGWVHGVALAAVGAMASALLWRGWSYYRLGLEARPVHVDYRALSPSHGLGRAYGIAAAALIFLSLVHVLRRRRLGANAGDPATAPVSPVVGTLVVTALVSGAFVALRLARPADALDSPLRAGTVLPLAAVAGWSLTSLALAAWRTVARGAAIARPRRRSASATSTTFWLHLHVFAGLAGAVLALFHSSFQVRTPLAAITVASLLAVLVTGFIGWFIGALCPAPEDPGADRLAAELDGLGAALGQRVADTLRELPVTEIGEATLLACVRAIPAWIGQSRRRRRAADRVVTEWADVRTRIIGRRDPAPSARRLARRLARRAVCRTATSAWLRTWRPLHRYATVVMLLAVVIHVAVAVTFGVAWGRLR